MSKDQVNQFDATAGNNADIEGINTSETMVPSAVNNAIRSLMSLLKKQEVGTHAMTSPDINGGTIDGATIATSDVTVGSGKTLDVSAGTLTLANDQISGDKVGGGTINSTFSGNLTGDVTGNTSGSAATVTGAAQSAITSVGTLTSFRSTGIDDNADALAITIDSSEKVGIGRSGPTAKLDVYSTSTTDLDIGKFEAAVGSYTGTSLIAANTLGPASSYSLFKCLTDSDADAGGPQTQFLVRGDGNVGVGTSHFGLFTAVAGSAKMAVVGDSTGTNVIGNTDAALAIVNKDGTASNTAGLHFARADTDETPNYASASIVCQFGATQVTGQYSAGSLHFSVSPWQNGAPSLKMTIASDGVISGDLNDTSDRNLKENIEPISTSIDIVKGLNPITFDWIAEEKGRDRAGFIAQDLEQILPNEVSGAEFDPEDEDNPTIGKSINVTGIVAHLTRALQESMAQIEALEARVAALESA